jgi:hypothetical protein
LKALHGYVARQPGNARCVLTLAAQVVDAWRRGQILIACFVSARRPPVEVATPYMREYAGSRLPHAIHNQSPDVDD